MTHSVFRALLIRHQELHPDTEELRHRAGNHDFLRQLFDTDTNRDGNRAHDQSGIDGLPAVEAKGGLQIISDAPIIRAPPIADQDGTKMATRRDVNWGGIARIRASARFGRSAAIDPARGRNRSEQRKQRNVGRLVPRLPPRNSLARGFASYALQASPRRT